MSKHCPIYYLSTRGLLSAFSRCCFGISEYGKELKPLEKLHLPGHRSSSGPRNGEASTLSTDRNLGVDLRVPTRPIPTSPSGDLCHVSFARRRPGTSPSFWRAYHQAQLGVAAPSTRMKSVGAVKTSATKQLIEEYERTRKPAASPLSAPLSRRCVARTEDSALCVRTDGDFASQRDVERWGPLLPPTHQRADMAP